MRSWLIVISLFLSCIFLHLKSFSQVDLMIASTDIAPVIDGVVDPLWNDYEATQLNNWLEGSPTTSSDFSAWFKTAWDTNNLYLLVVVTDDQLVYDSNDFWQDDAVEVYIDINNDKLTTYGSTDYQYAFRWNDTQMRTGGPMQNVDFKILQTSAGYNLEVKFPWATLGQSSPQANVMLGIDVHVHDDDDGGDRDNKLSWFAIDDLSYANPSLFATARLVGEITVLHPADKPNISVNHGFYDRPFNVTVSSAVPGMQIYYTLDGSNPAKSGAALVKQSPAIIRIDPNDTENRGKTPAVTLRASARKEGYDFSPAVTRTYLFLDYLTNQTTPPGHDWPEGSYVNEQEIDLLLDPKVLNDQRYSHQIDKAFTQIPTISVVTEMTNLFDPQIGIYVNAHLDGREWERPASIELINPDGSKGFQEDAGLRIRGGYSRNPWFRKHAFRLFFRNEYGAGKLNFPMFENEGVKSFDKIDLRCSQNYSWSKGTGEAPYGTYNRDVFSRDLQGLMNQPYTRSRYYHLYLNGLYWGLYQSQERAEARFAESYLGGNSDDYDVVKRGNGSYIEATDGTLDSWREVWNITQNGFSNSNNYFLLEGLNAIGQRDLSKKVLVDIDNLIDYMNIIFYTGNFDSPVSAFVNNKMPNNFYAIYNRNANEGFFFVAHDNEHALLIDPIGPGFGIVENRVNIGSISGNNRMTVSNFEQFHPQWLHHKLTENEEYRMRFADRAYKYYFNDGLLTPEKTAELFYRRTLEFDTAIIAESVRWGDVDGWITYNKDEHWTPIVQRTMNEYFPYRTNIVIDQLKNEGLLPGINPPEIRQNNSLVKNESIELVAGSSLDIRNPNHSGALFFTVDGNDPRITGGGIHSSAVNGENLYSINFFQPSILKSRVYDGKEWSALITLKVNVDAFIYGIQITEIHYNPLGGEGFAGSQYEFIELKNVSNEPVVLTNASFVDGIKYSFNTETIVNPGEFIVLASQPITFKMRYGFEPYGQYEGQLDNIGERVTLISATGQEIASVRYNDKTPWPSSADGLGFSLVPVTSDLTADWDDGNNWRASSVIGGTPNADDAGTIIPAVLVTEVLTSTDRPDVDAIELFNPNNYSVDISHWYLSDNRTIPQKWKIPAGTVIPANGYKVFYEGYYADTIKLFSEQNFGSAFALSSHGEEVFVFSGNSSGILTGYEHGYSFGESEKGVSFGSYLTSTGDDHFVPMTQLTLGSSNSNPKVGPVVFNRIIYHPIDNHFEFIELVNISAETVSLYDEIGAIGWRIAGVNFNFPRGTVMQPGETIYLIESAIHPEDFRMMQNIDAQVQLFNYTGKLDNSGERLEIRKPATAYVDDGEMIYPYVVIETVRYNDNQLWPDADGNGFALLRVNKEAYANDPANWVAAPAGMSISNYILAVGIEGVPYQHTLTANGGLVPYLWSIESGFLPSGLSLNGVTGRIEGTPLESGSFTFRISVTDQYDVSTSSTLHLTVNPNTLPVAYNDTVSTIVNYHITVDLFENDIDNDGDRPYWELSVTKEPVNGTYLINNDNTLTYFPSAGFAGTDELTYQLKDYSGTASAILYIVIQPEILAASFDVRVSQSSDDAEENIYSNQFWDRSSDLELTYDPSPGGDQIVGIRFQNLNIPQGATITKATIQFKNKEVNSGETNLTIQAETTNNALLFSENNLISTRQKTETSINWQPEPWLVIGEESEKQLTPDLSSVVQEVVNRGGWLSGNAMAFIITGTGTRVAWSFDGDPVGAPLLYIEYSTADEEAVVPVAIALTDSKVLINSVVELNGSQSFSADGRKLNYYWNLVSVPQGSQTQLSNQYIADPNFIPDLFGEYEVELKVSNGVFSSTETKVVITVVNMPPIADAGFNQFKVAGDVVVLNGSHSFDPEGNELSFSWTLVEKPQGSEAGIENANTVKPLLTTDLDGVYVVSLIVSDGENFSQADTVTITITNNQLPVAVAGIDQTVYTGEVVQLRGGDSYDPEDQTLSYVWSIVSKPAGSSMVLPNPFSKNTSFLADIAGVYVIKLVVNDGKDDSLPDEMTITVYQNTAPIADAGSNQQVDRGTMVALDGSASFDPDGTPLTYLWTFVTKPSGSMASLNNYAIAKPTFTPDKSGLYTLRMQVSDGIVTASNDVQIVVNPSNSVATYNMDLTMRVYPNPFTDRLFIETEAGQNEKVTFELYSINGMLIERIEQFSADGKTRQVHFNRNRLKNGIYLLMVKTDTQQPQMVRVTYRESRD